MWQRKQTLSGSRRVHLQLGVSYITCTCDPGLLYMYLSVIGCESCGYGVPSWLSL